MCQYKLVTQLWGKGSIFTAITENSGRAMLPYTGICANPEVSGWYYSHSVQLLCCCGSRSRHREVALYSEAIGSLFFFLYIFWRWEFKMMHYRQLLNSMKRLQMLMKEMEKHTSAISFAQKTKAVKTIDFCNMCDIFRFSFFKYFFFNSCIVISFHFLILLLNLFLYVILFCLSVALVFLSQCFISIHVVTVCWLFETK